MPPFRNVANTHANQVQHENVICTGCNTFVSGSRYHNSVWPATLKMLMLMLSTMQEILWTTKKTWQMIQGLLGLLFLLGVKLPVDSVISFMSCSIYKT